MIKVYYLPVETIDGTDVIAGTEYISQAIIDCTEDPDTRKAIANVTQEQHDALVMVAVLHRDPTPEETEYYLSTVIIEVPDPDTIRAEELLASSPGVITQPEMWELVRIFGRRLGYRF